MKKFLKSFTFAFKGLKLSLKQTNMRVHITVFIAVMYFSGFFDLNSFEYGLIFICSAMVMTAEVFNTSVEYLCNLYTTEYDERVKCAKDLAAAAVLVSAIFSAAVGIFIFWKPDVFPEILEYYKSIDKFVFLIACGILAYMFISDKLYKKRYEEDDTE